MPVIFGAQAYRLANIIAITRERYSFIFFTAANAIEPQSASTSGVQVVSPGASRASEYIE
jgi:hypothetical protein